MSKLKNKYTSKTSLSTVLYVGTQLYNAVTKQERHKGNLKQE